ncbi:thiamine phosphate synthase [Bacillus weihaiensis]|uniref:Thiamine-phosphate synthase n=1 Tax=Bacillus weihaiensis TaxID=1547283 RepID=A0A1L3MU89_9BACI|nr:thiamine phosphate synthase [Bacillus weihaiensis]APH05893.1 thiamine-phosphate diphosphorylase [Bacillus weihaiensis]
MNIREALRLYFVMGSQNCKKRDPEKTLTEALDGGITLFQYREKGECSVKDEEKMYLGKKLKQLCEAYQVPFIVNDDLELAIELDADGLHIGQEDGSPHLVRQKFGGNKWLGISTHSVLEVKQAIRDGADYIGVGPMYKTTTKEDASEVVGPELIRAIRNTDEQMKQLPIVGIGGISLSNAKQVYAAGADGIAVISAITNADSISDVTKQLVMMKK